MTKLWLALVACLLIAPAAAAHNTVQTDDEEYFLTIGHQAEPTATFLRSGLDLTVRENVDGEPGDEVPGLADQLQATMISPSGEEFSQPLSLQFGSTGRYSFGDPYILTEPGQYRLRLVGTIGETTVDGTYDISGSLEDFRDLTFPRSDVPSPLELQDRVAELEAENAALEARIEALEQGGSSVTAASEGAPGFMPLLAIAGVVGVALLRRR